MFQYLPLFFLFTAFSHGPHLQMQIYFLFFSRFSSYFSPFEAQKLLSQSNHIMRFFPQNGEQSGLQCSRGEGEGPVRSAAGGRERGGEGGGTPYPKVLSRGTSLPVPSWWGKHYFVRGMVTMVFRCKDTHDNFKDNCTLPANHSYLLAKAHQIPTSQLASSSANKVLCYMLTIALRKMKK